MEKESHEEKKKRKAPSIRQLFASSVSFTGGDRLVSKNVLQRRIWLVILILAMMALSYHLSTVVTEYQKYAVNTVVKQYMFGFWFPDVTICAGLPFSKKKAPPEGIGMASAKRFWNYALKYDDRILSQIKSLNKAQYSFKHFAYDRDIYSSILDSIHYCFYLGKPCFRQNFKRLRNPVRHNCITFSPHHKVIVVPDKDAGLHIVLSSEESYNTFNSINELHEIPGFQVIIHEAQTTPPIQKDTTIVSPGSQVLIRMRMSNYSKTNTPTNPCFEEQDIIDRFKSKMSEFISKKELDSLKFQGQYTEDDCVNLLAQYLSLKTCNCLQDTVPFPWGIKINKIGCHDIPKKFFFNDGITKEGILHYKNETINLTKSKLFKAIVKRANCSSMLNDYSQDYQEMLKKMESCPRRCTRKLYTNHVTTDKWPASKMHLMETLKAYHASGNRFTPNKSPNLNDSFKYLSSIVVYPSDLSVFEAEESLAYPLSQLFADFGGNIGLWVGSSVLSLAEIVEVFYRVFKKKINPDESLEKKFSRRKSKGSTRKTSQTAIELATLESPAEDDDDKTSKQVSEESESSQNSDDASSDDSDEIDKEEKSNRDSSNEDESKASKVDEEKPATLTNSHEESASSEVINKESENAKPVKDDDIVTVEILNNETSDLQVLDNTLDNTTEKKL